MKKNYKFNKNSKICDILNDSDGLSVFQKYAPLLLMNPIVKYGSQFPIKIIRYTKFGKEINMNAKVSKKIIKEICKIEK